MAITRVCDENSRRRSRYDWDVIRPGPKKALSFVTSKAVSVDAAETLERTRGNEIFVALLFVNLQFYFGPVLEDFEREL